MELHPITFGVKPTINNHAYVTIITLTLLLYHIQGQPRKQAFLLVKLAIVPIESGDEKEMHSSSREMLIIGVPATDNDDTPVSSC